MSNIDILKGRFQRNTKIDKIVDYSLNYKQFKFVSDEAKRKQNTLIYILSSSCFIYKFQLLNINKLNISINIFHKSFFVFF